jgi:hypothetical protein
LFAGARPKIPSLIDSSFEIKKGKFLTQYFPESYYLSSGGGRMQKLSSCSVPDLISPISILTLIGFDPSLNLYLYVFELETSYTFVIIV